MLEFIKTKASIHDKLITYNVVFPKGLTVQSLLEFLNGSDKPPLESMWGYLLYEGSSLITRYKLENNIMYNSNLIYNSRIITDIQAIQHVDQNRMDYTLTLEGGETEMNSITISTETLCSFCDHADVCKFKEDREAIEKQILDTIKTDHAIFKMNMACIKYMCETANRSFQGQE